MSWISTISIPIHRLRQRSSIGPSVKDRRPTLLVADIDHDGKTTGTFRGHAGTISITKNTSNPQADPNTFCTWGTDGMTRLYDLRHPLPVLTVEGDTDGGSCSAVSAHPDGIPDAGTLTLVWKQLVVPTLTITGTAALNVCQDANEDGGRASVGYFLRPTTKVTLCGYVFDAGDHRMYESASFIYSFGTNDIYQDAKADVSCPTEAMSLSKCRHLSEKRRSAMSALMTVGERSRALGCSTMQSDDTEVEVYEAVYSGVLVCPGKK
ncbi:hypothetical protein VKT23_006716 [Stygiomarasmius scandens]|uniref:Uncharacterized protein n=1 Tax=Marasmiellus scandens TaxID=2682957 RepID=A0ABR1IQD5_9AGAR